MEGKALDTSLSAISFALLRSASKRKSAVSPEGKNQMYGNGRRRSSCGEYKRPRHPRKFYIHGRPHPVDFVLVYQRKTLSSRSSAETKINNFHEKLRRHGLILEIDRNLNRDEVYVKIYAPFQVLTRYADVLKLKMPVPKKCCPKESRSHVHTFGKAVTRFLLATKLIKWFIPALENFPKLKRGFGWPFTRNREYIFDVPNNLDDFFTFNERSYIVSYILRNCRYGDEKFEFGLGRLLKDGIYSAGFCPHTGEWDSETPNMRKLLNDHWAHWRNWCKMQPIDHVREYFGSEVGLYFAWMGHYIMFLLVASLVCCVIFTASIFISISDKISDVVCEAGSNITMCPLCDHSCFFWKLSDSCTSFRFARLFNNDNTLVYTIFMAIWGMLFLIYWEREQSELLYRWRLYESENFALEQPRPEFTRYLARKRKKAELKDPQPCCEDGKTVAPEEAHIPFWSRRLPTVVGTYSFVFLLLSVAIGSVFGTIACRLSLYAMLQTQEYLIVYSYARMISAVSAAVVNLLIIVIMTVVYERLAVWLTNLEMRRTDSNFHDSLALKLYLLQFINNFGSIFWISFVRNNFGYRPGEKTNIASGGLIGAEECDMGGCMFDISIQMVIVFVGKQVWNNIKDPILVFLNKVLNRVRYGSVDKTAAFAKDFTLVEFVDEQLIFENMEMMIQYGFMCFFIAAFPVAPLFALINNIIEIRRDATKFVRHYRRPTAKPVKGIGIWQGILLTTTRMSVFTNALLIALTSDFIPLTYYSLTVKNWDGYINFTLSYFNTSDYPDKSYQHPDDPMKNTTICRYRQFRNPPWDKKPYLHSPIYWEILAYKLMFIVVFENILLALTKTLKWIIPSQASNLREKIRRKTEQVTDYILHSEIVLAKVAPFLKRWYRKGCVQKPLVIKESNV